MRGMKQGNEYQMLINSDLYAEMPKAVIAAVLVSSVMRISGSNDFSEVSQLIAAEWQTLHDNGIVPQKPGMAAQAAMAD